MTNLEIALSYATNGTPIFPCRATDKVPIPSNGFRGATTCERIIRIWAERHPDCLWAMPTGERTGVWVLDIDPRHGGEASLADLEAENGKLPATRTVRTRSGGTHFYWHWSGQTNSPGRLKGTGIDVRGNGGLVILPGSTGYMLEIDVPVVEAPEWLLALIRPRPFVPVAGVPYQPQTHDAYVTAAVSRELETLASTSKGSRGWQLNASAYLIGQFVGAGALAVDEAAHELFDAACRCGVVHVDGERAVRKSIERGLKDGAQRPRQLPERKQSPSVNFDKMIANALARQAAA